MHVLYRSCFRVDTVYGFDGGMCVQNNMLDTRTLSR